MSAPQTAPPEGTVTLTRDGPVATIVFDRPHARNAMTWTMYDALSRHCETLAGDDSVRCVVFRGAGGAAFVAGSDIAQFRSFEGAQDGLRYEAHMDGQMAAIEAIKVPTLAVVEGWAVGAGINIAATCDLRIATHGTRFGVPIARTVGNCLSMTTMKRLVGGFGPSRTKRMLLLAEFLSAEEALEAGFLARLVAPQALEETVAEVTDKLVAHAPLTMRASKEAIARIASGEPGDGRDLITLIYGSEDFKRGVAAFTDKTKPDFTGR